MTYTNLSEPRAIVLSEQIKSAVEDMQMSDSPDIEVRIRNDVTGLRVNGDEIPVTEFRVTGHGYFAPSDLFDVLEDGEHLTHVSTHIDEEVSHVEVVRETSTEDSIFV